VRICQRLPHRHNCFFHGEFRQDPESDSGDDSADDGVDNDADDDEDDDADDDDTSSDHVGEGPPHKWKVDSDVEKIINYRVPVNPDAPVDDTGTGPCESTPPVPPNGAFKPRWWLDNSNTNWETRKPFIPCKHEGSCVDARCRCVREGITCEKSCGCASLCSRRFPGCNCAAISGKRTCASDICLCFKFKRECDADLCGFCGAREMYVTSIYTLRMRLVLTSYTYV
jgi:hypothetical protein